MPNYKAECLEMKDLAWFVVLSISLH